MDQSAGPAQPDASYPGINIAGAAIGFAAINTVRDPNFAMNGKIHAPFGMKSFLAGKGGLGGALGAGAGAMLYTGNPFMAAIGMAIGAAGGMAEVPGIGPFFNKFKDGGQGNPLLPTPTKRQRFTDRSVLGRLGRGLKGLATAPINPFKAIGSAMSAMKGFATGKSALENRYQSIFQKRMGKYATGASTTKLAGLARDVTNRRAGLDYRTGTERGAYTGHAQPINTNDPRYITRRKKYGLAAQERQAFRISNRVDLAAEALMSGKNPLLNVSGTADIQDVRNQVRAIQAQHKPPLMQENINEIKALSKKIKTGKQKVASIRLNANNLAASAWDLGGGDDMISKGTAQYAGKRADVSQTKAQEKLDTLISKRAKLKQDLKGYFKSGGLTIFNNARILDNQFSKELLTEGISSAYRFESGFSMLGGRYKNINMTGTSKAAFGERLAEEGYKSFWRGDISKQQATRNILKTNIAQSIAGMTDSELRREAMDYGVDMGYKGKISKQLKTDLSEAIMDKAGVIGGAAKFAKVLGVVSGVSLAKDVAMLGVNAGLAAARGVSNVMAEMRALEFGGPGQAVSTGQASTERQRALQALNNSTMNARQFIGQEASLIHG